MWMTDSQIYVLYRDSRSRGKEIKILAELNDCSVDTIRLILHRQGADVSIRGIVREDAVSADQLKEAKKLRTSGLTYRRIAEATGIPIRSVRYYLSKFRKEEDHEIKNVVCDRANESDRSTDQSAGPSSRRNTS